MRIIVLSILFAGSYYFLTKEDAKILPEIDSVKLKMSANDHDRVERILTVDKPKLSPEEAAGASEEVILDKPVGEVSSGAEYADLEHVEEVQLNDLEEGWNNELKEMLTRLEPAEGETIHKSYLSEQESYQAELDALMSEKQQKTTEEASLEVEQLIGQLDQKHQDKLKEIFGAHYEAVRDGYEHYMDSAEDN
jgi:hypothetical protein